MDFTLTERDIATASRSRDILPVEPLRTPDAGEWAPGQVVRAVAPAITNELISPSHLAHLEAIADRLSARLTNYFGFECRLGETAPLADILFCVRQIASQPMSLAGLVPGIPEAWAQQEPVWQQLQDFGREWAAPTSRLFRKVQDVWLEFDVAGPPHPVPVPSLFFGSKVIHAGFPRHAHRWISDDAVRLLVGRPLTDSLQQALLYCIAALPHNALLFQMGAMLSREPAFVRICVSRLSSSSLLEYLKALGWDGDRVLLTTLIAELAPFTSGFSLNLDLLEGTIGPKIGLECGLAKDGHAAEWKPFLDYLVAQGLCLPGKREGLLHYLTAENSAYGIERGLHHIKVVLQGDRPLQAKAYLSIVSEAI